MGEDFEKLYLAIIKNADAFTEAFMSKNSPKLDLNIITRLDGIGNKNPKGSSININLDSREVSSLLGRIFAKMHFINKGQYHDKMIVATLAVKVYFIFGGLGIINIADKSLTDIVKDFMYGYYSVDELSEEQTIAKMIDIISSEYDI